MGIIASNAQVSATDNLKVTFGYSAFEPSFPEAGPIREALEAAGYSVLLVEAPTILKHKITATVHASRNGYASEFGTEMALAIGGRFWLVWDVTPEKYETVAVVVGDPGPAVSTQTTVSLVAVAILALVALIVAAKTGVLG